jgi:2-keto-4-pentenoate hydratase/2-oxohepta-3-ene-1,7-dioic acid hydratase in catechol pathway
MENPIQVPTKLPVVVVEQELGMVLETSISDLLFRPLEGWVIGYIQVNDLTIRELHDDEDVENTKPNRVLYKEVAGPHGLGLVL